MKKGYLKHVFVLVFFALVTSFYFSEVVFDGKKLETHDINQHRGGSREIVKYRDAGKQPLWTNSMFSGMPAYLISTVYESNYVSMMQQFIRFGIPYPVSNIFLAMLCFYIMALCFKVPWHISVIGSIMYAFASFNFISLAAGHNTKILAIAFLPLVVGGVHLVINKKYILGAALLALGIALEIDAGHIQITYYLALLLLFYGVSYTLYYLIREKDVKSFLIASAVIICSVVLGVLPHTSRLWTVQEYGKYSIRGKSELTPRDENEESKTDGLDKDYAFAWSQGVYENITFLIPNFYGGTSSKAFADKDDAYYNEVGNWEQSRKVNLQQANQLLVAVRHYWGDQPGTSGPVYLGAIACFLFLFGALIVENKNRYWLIAGFFLSLFISMGKNFFINDILFDYLPGFNKFRTVSMAVSIAQLVVPLMAVLALKRISEIEDKKILLKPFYISLGVTAGISIIFVILSGVVNTQGGSEETLKSLLILFREEALNSSPSLLREETLKSCEEALKSLPSLLDALAEDRSALIRADAFRSFIYIFLGAGIVYLLIKNSVKLEYALIALGLIVMIDGWSLNLRYLNSDNYSNSTVPFKVAQTDRDIKEMNSGDKHYRVYNLNNPFNEAGTSYYHKSIGGYTGAKMRRYQDIIERHISQNNVRVLQMLNTKTVVFPPSQQGPARAQAFQGLGNAWFVNDVEIVDNPDMEIDYLGNEQFAPQKNAVVDASKFQLNNKYSGKGEIKLSSYNPDKMQYTSTLDNDGLAVFSEIYYPKGWKAYIDNNEVEIKRVNYILRALEIPKGKHKIVFEFKPASYYTGEKISLISSIVLLLAVLGAIVYSLMEYIKKEKLVVN